MSALTTERQNRVSMPFRASWQLCVDSVRRIDKLGVTGSVRRETGMEKEMRELYVEGVAIHDGPESCAGVREGVGEALTGVRAGSAMEPRN